MKIALDSGLAVRLNVKRLQRDNGPLKYLKVVTVEHALLSRTAK
jgi:hypothetical protein